MEKYYKDIMEGKQHEGEYKMAQNEIQKYMKQLGKEVGIEMKNALRSPPKPKKPYKMKHPHPLAIIKKKNKKLMRLGYIKNPTQAMYNDIVKEILSIKKEVRRAKKF